jgi:hypothetical protein
MQFLAQQYKDALEQYQAAVKEWDHPAIRDAPMKRRAM